MPDAATVGELAAPAQIEWADEVLSKMIDRIRDGGGTVPREFLVQLVTASALVGIGWELRKISRALGA